MASVGTSRRGGRSLPFFGQFLLVVLVVVAGTWWMLTRTLGLDVSLRGIRAPQPLGTPPPAPAGQGGYAFSEIEPGTRNEPVTYSPCQPIHVLVNAKLAPPGAEGLAASSLNRISELTGLRFVLGGATAELPSGTPRGEGDPVLIAWTTPDVVPALEGDVAGLGGSTATSAGGSERRFYVSGQVSLDAPQLAHVLQGPNGRAHVRAVILHELGHLVGLAHVDDTGELMYPANIGRLDFADGDKRGLAILGRGHCLPIS